MQTYKDGKILDYTNATGSTQVAGTLVAVGGRVGVLPFDLAAGDSCGVETTGLYKHAKTSGVVITAGDTAYMDESEDELTNVPTDNVLVGSFPYAVASTVTTAIVAINEFSNAAVLATA